MCTSTTALSGTEIHRGYTASISHATLELRKMPSHKLHTGCFFWTVIPKASLWLLAMQPLFLLPIKKKCANFKRRRNKGCHLWTSWNYAGRLGLILSSFLVFFPKSSWMMFTAPKGITHITLCLDNNFGYSLHLINGSTTFIYKLTSNLNFSFFPSESMIRTTNGNTDLNHCNSTNNMNRYHSKCF